MIKIPDFYSFYTVVSFAIAYDLEIIPSRVGIHSNYMADIYAERTISFSDYIQAQIYTFHDIKGTLLKYNLNLCQQN